MSSKAILVFPDGTRLEVEGRAAQLAMTIVLHQDEVNRPDIGHIECAFQRGHLHPLRVVTSLLAVNLPPVSSRSP